MKNYVLSAALLCGVSSVTMHAVVKEEYALENLMQHLMQLQLESAYTQMVMFVRELQDGLCLCEFTFDQVKEIVAQRFGGLKKISDDEEESSPEQAMMQQQAREQAREMLKQAIAAVAKVTRDNQLPAIEGLKKGVDAQALRRKVIEYIEAYLK